MRKARWLIGSTNPETKPAIYTEAAVAKELVDARISEKFT
jgi:hypothetical protein